jgi:hypothetical protein
MKHRNILGVDRSYDKSLNAILYNNQKGEENVMFFKDFKEQSDMLTNIKKAIDMYPSAEITERDIQIESMN